MAKDVKKTVDDLNDEEKDLDTEIEDEDTDLDADKDDHDEDEDNPEGDDSSDDDPDNDDANDKEKIARLEKQANKYRRLYQKARKNSAPSKDTETKRGNPAPAASNMDERILLSQGMDPKLIKELKDIAALRGTGLIEAQSDPLFTRSKELYEEEKARKQKSLGASRGSGGTKVQKTFATPGLSKEEHRKMAKEKLSAR